MKEKLGVLVLYLMLVVGLLIAFVVGQNTRAERLEDLDRTDDPTCVEDEPCWDCKTMGNLRCGTLP